MGKTVLHADGHEQPGHEWEVEGHMALIPLAEVGSGLGRPLVGLGQEHAVGELAIDMFPELSEEGVGLREVFATGALPLKEVGHGVQAKPVHAHAEPIIPPTERAPA